MRRPCAALLCVVASLCGRSCAFSGGLGRSSRLRPSATSLRMGFFDFGKKAAPPVKNDEVFKPKLGRRVDDTLNTIPQKGPSMDAGSAKMVGFYGVLAAAVGLALSYSPPS